MLRFLFFGLIPLMLIFAAPVFQLILSIKALKGKTKLNLLWVSFIALILGVLLPVGATFISIYGLPPGTKCATGSVGLVLGGVDDYGDDSTDYRNCDVCIVSL
ncbi:hypothetical protein [Mucilaginibacter gotjawali]|uniref:Uncharacterized protein n=1 Tax=Mucilaginibacter gotjawali TaxID=1550579 RepID=A0A839SGG0_9SPHI|nr:hypothetical protein [Mucilaginibacter gotjawali]MBB3055617.1 hypothetical protein [Mucilaginibacter gotjawali]